MTPKETNSEKDIPSFTGDSQSITNSFCHYLRNRNELHKPVALEGSPVASSSSSSALHSKNVSQFSPASRELIKKSSSATTSSIEKSSSVPHQSMKQPYSASMGSKTTIISPIPKKTRQIWPSIAKKIKSSGNSSKSFSSVSKSLEMPSLSTYERGTGSITPVTTNSPLEALNYLTLKRLYPDYSYPEHNQEGEFQDPVTPPISPKPDVLFCFKISSSEETLSSQVLQTDNFPALTYIKMQNAINILADCFQFYFVKRLFNNEFSLEHFIQLPNIFHKHMIDHTRFFIMKDNTFIFKITAEMVSLFRTIITSQSRCKVSKQAIYLETIQGTGKSTQLYIFYCLIIGIQKLAMKKFAEDSKGRDAFFEMYDSICDGFSEVLKRTVLYIPNLSLGMSPSNQILYFLRFFYPNDCVTNEMEIEMEVEMGESKIKIHEFFEKLEKFSLKFSEQVFFLIDQVNNLSYLCNENFFYFETFFRNLYDKGGIVAASANHAEMYQSAIQKHRCFQRFKMCKQHPFSPMDDKSIKDIFFAILKYSSPYVNIEDNYGGKVIKIYNMLISFCCGLPLRCTSIAKSICNALEKDITCKCEDIMSLFIEEIPQRNKELMKDYLTFESRLLGQWKMENEKSMFFYFYQIPSNEFITYDRRFFYEHRDTTNRQTYLRALFPVFCSIILNIYRNGLSNFESLKSAIAEIGNSSSGKIYERLFLKCIHLYNKCPVPNDVYNDFQLKFIKITGNNVRHFPGKIPTEFTNLPVLFYPDDDNYPFADFILIHKLSSDSRSGKETIQVVFIQFTIGNSKKKIDDMIQKLRFSNYSLEYQYLMNDNEAYSCLVKWTRYIANYLKKSFIQYQKYAIEYRILLISPEIVSDCPSCIHQVAFPVSTGEIVNLFVNSDAE